MQAPDDPLAPIGHSFAEPWHAQVLAMAEALIRARHLTASEWAATLGQSLRDAEMAGKPDSEETYYLAALDALERIAPVEPTALAGRKSAWKAAYRRTPHGQPVTLDTTRS